MSSDKQEDSGLVRSYLFGAEGNLAEARQAFNEALQAIDKVVSAIGEMQNNVSGAARTAKATAGVGRFVQSAGYLAQLDGLDSGERQRERESRLLQDQMELQGQHYNSMRRAEDLFAVAMQGINLALPEPTNPVERDLWRIVYAALAQKGLGRLFDAGSWRGQWFAQ